MNIQEIMLDFEKFKEDTNAELRYLHDSILDLKSDVRKLEDV